MAAKLWLLALMIFCHVIPISACEEINFKTDYLQKGIFCSAQMEDVSTVKKLVQLFYQQNVIGIYKRPNRSAQVCYWKLAESGLVDLMTLNGGTFKSSGTCTKVS